MRLWTDGDALLWWCCLLSLTAQYIIEQSLPAYKQYVVLSNPLHVILDLQILARARC